MDKKESEEEESVSGKQGEQERSQSIYAGICNGVPYAIKTVMGQPLAN